MTKTFLFLFLSLLLSFSAFSQQKDIPIAQGKEYTIGGIKVTGTDNYNERTVIAFTGLSEGDNIYIPGDKLSKVIQKLWDLGLFSDINFYVTKIEDDKAFLELEIKEVPELNKVKISGIKAKKRKKLKEENDLEPEAKATDNLIATTRSKIQKKYREDGYVNADVDVRTQPIVDSTGQEVTSKVDMFVDIDKGEKVKITDIEFHGNDIFSNWKVRRQMSNTKRKNFLRFWKRSKFIKEKYEEDKESIIDEYKSKGYRDARIVSDSITRVDEDDIKIDINLEEGDKYYFGDISFLGNTKYSDKQLRNILKIKKGDVYNGVLLEKQVQNTEKPDAQDLTNLYQNNGYLFSRINTVETKVYNDTIDFEIRVHEGKEAYFDNIIVKGNDKTNDNVIYRNIRTKPGQKYSRSKIMRSVRELGQLGFFDAEKLKPTPKNVNPNDGTLDLEYKVVESGASQIELQGGYGGGGFVGTLGLSFNNFSIANIFNADAYHPLPTGDGQELSLRAQASSFYQTYSLSFSEPWLGGKKPIRLTTSFSHTVQFFRNYRKRETDRNRKFLITGGSVGLAKRLEWPDDYFTLSGSIAYKHYDLQNYNVGLFRFPNGSSDNISLTLGLSRDNTATNPIFPTRGSKFEITAKLTPPYSLFNDVDYGNLENMEEYQKSNGDPDYAKIDQKRFNYLEYFKLKFKGDWYNKLIDKLVLRTNVEYGFLGAYDNDRGIPPFERFYLGGDGLGGYSLDGRENIRLRGYPNQSLIPISRNSQSAETEFDGATIYNKYSLELRYPITLKRTASIYGLTFLEGGASYDGFKDFNPFQLNRSAGFGVRIFMPAFGLLGIDFGYGFDPIPGTNSQGANGWETHFIIGQQF